MVKLKLSVMVIQSVLITVTAMPLLLSVLFLLGVMVNGDSRLLRSIGVSFNE